MRRFIYVLLLLIAVNVNAQNNIDFQKPPKEILELADVERAPSVILDNNKENMVLLYRDAYKTIEELSQEELRLGGLRIDPKTNIGSRTNYSNNIKLRRLKSKSVEAIQVKGLPENARLSNYVWSPDQSKLAFTNTNSEGVAVWILDVTSAMAKRITDPKVNANLRDPINWFKDGNAVLVKFVASNKKELINSKNSVPTGPTISTNDGKKAQNRTYQDLLKNKTDEHNFEQLALSDLYKVKMDGSKEKWLPSAMYRSVSFSPDGNYVMITIVEEPFSYLVPYYRFPSKTTIYTKDAQKVEDVLTVPLIEDLPQGFMAVRKGRRNVQWRLDVPSSLIYVEALDEGDPANEVEYRDEIFQLDAPFKGNGKSILKTVNRFYDIEWGNENIAVAHDYWWNTRNTKSYTFNPSDASQAPIKIYDRNYQDRYNDPGSFVTSRNQYGKYILALEGDNAFLLGDGFSKEGQFPFLDKLNLKTSKTQRLYQSTYTDKIEDLRDFDVKKKELLVRIESNSEYPNYFFRKLKGKKLKQITSFENPFKSIEGVHKEVITYKEKMV